MKIGVPKESRPGETRVACSPESLKKFLKKFPVEVLIERSSGLSAGFSDSDYEAPGVMFVDADTAFAADIVFKVQPPTPLELKMFKRGALLLSFLEPLQNPDGLTALSQAFVDGVSLELVPRTSRAQSMDALSSQANVAGYRAVLEATLHYKRFFPLMMTSAGSAKPAKVLVLGAGVAGLQAIATARRLGAQVEGYDVRPEVKEQILSLGAKVVEFELGEEGAGAGGYARELTESAKIKQQALLTEKIKKSDIVISTANIPGKKAPLLITEEAVSGMRLGSVIIDMAAASGGNCSLTQANQVVVKRGVTLVGVTNFPALVPADSSHFYSQNLFSLLALMIEQKENNLTLNINLEDDIIAAALVTYNGAVRFSKR